MSSTLTMPAEPGAAPELGPSSGPKRPWVYGPWLDLMVGCGAWSAPLLLLTTYTGRFTPATWSFAFYFLALLFNYPHFMATIYRAYHAYDEFAKYRFFTVHVTLLLAVTGLVAHLWYPLLPWIFTLYICWSPWHYTGQNFGLLMMFARRTGVVPTEQERRALRLAFVASFVMLMVSFHTGPSNDPLILSLGLAAKFTTPIRLLLAAFFVVASGWALRSLSRRSSWRALLPTATLVFTQFMWFLLPVLIEVLSGREVPQIRYSSGILAVMHSAQYLWITSYYQAKEARANQKETWSFGWYVVTLVAGGIALFIPGPWIVSRVFHVDFAASFLTFTALVNLHHFLLDGAIWKLRDSRIAALLLNKLGSGKEVAVGAPNTFARGLHWLASTSPASRALRIAAVALLFAWAALDQLHFFWSSEASSLPALERAAKLNPEDSSVQARLARAELLAGNRDASLLALQHAAEISPGNFVQQEAYARGLIEAGRTADAYSQYQKILGRWPRNIDALVNSGLLGQRLGHGDEAIDDWERAVDIDATQSNAQIYLAQVLEQRGEAQAAARHYRAYLQIVAAHRTEHAGEGSTVIAALIKVADANAAAKQGNEAIQGYRAAIAFAEKANAKAPESLALIHLADL